MKGPLWSEKQTDRDAANSRKLEEFKVMFIATFGRDAYEFLKHVHVIIGVNEEVVEDAEVVDADP